MNRAPSPISLRVGVTPVDASPRALSCETQAVLAVIVVSLLARIALACVMGFSFDETYDVVVARKLALAYFDHPPAIMWLIHAVVALTGSEDHLIVRLPTLLLFSAQNWLLYRLTAQLFDRRAGLFAVIAISLSPQFFYFGTIAVTDGPLIFALTGAALFAARAVFAEGATPWRDWLLAGLFFGLALLSKFSAILVLPGLVLVVVTIPRHRRLFFAPAPYVAALVAVLVFTPVIVWNFQNGFASLLFQGDRAALGAELEIGRTLTHIAILMLVSGPPVWLAQVAALAGALRAGPRDEPRWFFAMLATVPIGLFLVIDLFGIEGVAATHWPAPGYLFTFPLVGAAVAQLSARFPRAIRATVGAVTAGMGILVLVMFTHVLTGWLGALAPSFNAYDPIVSDQADWWNFRDTLQERGLLDSRRYFVLAGRYELCFKAQLVLKDSLPVVCLTDNPISKSLWRDDAALRGRDAIIIFSWWDAPQSLATVHDKFRRVEEIAPIWMTAYGRPVTRVGLALGSDLQRSIFEAQP
jgi:4-amino-4-deoxy-L-arabinose transferase-like glycosyltransferase